MNVNKVILVGRVTDAPETRTTPGGQMVCNLRLATNRVWKDASGQRQEKTEFHTVILWRRLAEIASQYLQKGALAYIEGRLETRSWQDQTGVKKYRTEIIGENLQLGPKPGGAQAPSKPQAQQPVKEEEIPIIEEDGEIDVKDIPF
ncbi:MAG: single-stranded DNA-binding protein [Candidatus Wildermuthbacteria bacterium]|nr:single-stranded DNA-binding protein [Candidatus Wildermuthbacteria bacterium]